MPCPRKHCGSPLKVMRETRGEAGNRVVLYAYHLSLRRSARRPFKGIAPMTEFTCHCRTQTIS